MQLAAVFQGCTRLAYLLVPGMPASGQLNRVLSLPAVERSSGLLLGIRRVQTMLHHWLELGVEYSMVAHSAADPGFEVRGWEAGQKPHQSFQRVNTQEPQL